MVFSRFAVKTNELIKLNELVFLDNFYFFDLISELDIISCIFYVFINYFSVPFSTLHFQIYFHCCYMIGIRAIKKYVSYHQN